MKKRFSLNKLNQGLLNGVKAAIASLVILSLAGCLDDKKCTEEFERIIKPIKINGGKNIVFDIDDFDFLLKSNLVIDDIILQGELDDKGDEPQDFSFDINGIKAVRKDGGKHIELDRKKGCRYRSSVHKFLLNGGEPFALFMAKIKFQKGQLVLNMHAKKTKIINAELVVRGKKYVKCDTPPPPPPPTPVAPETSINSVNPVGNVVSNSNMTINFSANQTNVTFWCKLDGAPASTCTSPISYSGLSNGSHNFSVYAVNSAGLADATPASYSWNVDTVPPSVTIDNLASLPSITNQTSIGFVFSSNEAGTFTCALDGGTAQPCTSPATFNGLGEGAHNIIINIVDTAGNASLSPATYNWQIDLTTPVASILHVSPSAAVNNASTLNIEFAANESASFECSIDNGAFSSCSSPLAVNNITEGSHWFAVRAIDVAGNVGMPVSYNWTTDLTAPVVTLVNSVPAQGLTNANNVFVEFSISENASAVCTWDSVSAPCTSPFTSSANEGVHTLQISASDLAGNEGAPVTLTWTMDFTNPVLSWGAITPSPSAYLRSQDVTLEVIPSEVVTFTSKINGVDAAQSSSPLVFTGLAEGTYLVEVTALDSAGNPSASISHTFTVDITVPILNLSAAISGLTNLDHNTLTFSANENVSFTCNIDAAGFAACSSPLEISGLADGGHSVDVIATDLAGNVSATGNASWIVDASAPNTLLTAEQLNRNTFRFTLGSSESPVTFVCSSDGAVFQSCSSPVTLTFADGDHTFAAKAIDAAGNTDGVGASHTFTVLPVVTTSIVSATATGLTNSPSQTISFTSNYPSATFLCSVDGSAAAACASPVTYSGLADGAHSFLVKAIDTFGTIDTSGASISWTKDTIAPSTSLDTTQNTHNTFTFNFHSNEPGTFICSIDGGAFAPCPSTLNYTATIGSHSIVARAVDLAGNTDQEGASDLFMATAPLNTIINSASATNLVNFSTQTIAFSSSVSGATFKCALDSGAMAPCTSPVSFSGLSEGAHTFTVKAVAPWGQTDNVGASVSWSVDTVAPTVTGTSFTTTSTTATINWTTNEPATSSLLWGLTPNTNNTVPDDGVLKTSHSIRIVGLSPSTNYSVRPTGHDQAGNQYVAGPFIVRTAR